MVARAYTSDTDRLAATLSSAFDRIASLERASGQGGSADLARWNSSWGVIGKGVMAGYSGTAVASGASVDISAPINVNLVAGRRYRIAANIRATSAAGVSGYLRLGGNGIASNDNWSWIGGSYQHQSVEAFVDATTSGAATYTCLFYAGGAASIWTDQQVSWFIVEDVGPISKAATTPPQGGSLVVAPGNAIGIVAIGPLLTDPTTLVSGQMTPITGYMPVFTAVGRRYRVSVIIRAFGPVGGATQSSMRSQLMDGANLVTGIGQSDTDRWFDSSNNWGGGDISVVLDGNGAARNFRFVTDGAPTTQVYVTEFYCEDLGPSVSPGAPLPDLDPPWTPMPLSNSWGNYDPGNSSWQTARIRRVGDIVTAEGLIRNLGATPSATFANLPPQFRPKVGRVKSALIDQAGTGTISYIRADVQSGGAMVFSVGGGAFTSPVGYVSIEGMSWTTS